MKRVSHEILWMANFKSHKEEGKNTKLLIFFWTYNLPIGINIISMHCTVYQCSFLLKLYHKIVAKPTNVTFWIQIATKLIPNAFTCPDGIDACSIFVVCVRVRSLMFIQNNKKTVNNYISVSSFFILSWKMGKCVSEFTSKKLRCFNKTKVSVGKASYLPLFSLHFSFYSSFSILYVKASQCETI